MFREPQNHFYGKVSIPASSGAILFKSLTRYRRVQGSPLSQSPPERMCQCVRIFSSDFGNISVIQPASTYNLLPISGRTVTFNYDLANSGVCLNLQNACA